MLSDLLTLDRVKVPLFSQTKESVLRELVELALPEAAPAIVASVVASVLERERLLSTGIGSGIAIPHGRTSAVGTTVLTAGVSRVPIDFDALDGRPVSLFFLLLGPESAAGAHVRALGRISRILRHESVRADLVDATSAEGFLQRLDGAEVV